MRAFTIGSHPMDRSQRSNLGAALVTDLALPGYDASHI
nr:hypothetical protein JVH1_2414 [Rhodococcus sp. JVH1]